MAGVAGDTSDAAGAMDLLSVIVHELGHVLDLDAHAELSETLAVGSRLMPSDPAPEAPVPALSPAMAYAIRVLAAEQARSADEDDEQDDDRADWVELPLGPAALL